MCIYIYVYYCLAYMNIYARTQFRNLFLFIYLFIYLFIFVFIYLFIHLLIFLSFFYFIFYFIIVSLKINDTDIIQGVEIIELTFSLNYYLVSTHWAKAVSFILRQTLILVFFIVLLYVYFSLFFIFLMYRFPPRMDYICNLGGLVNFLIFMLYCVLYF